MSRFSSRWPIAACLATGAGLYVTQGVLDQGWIGDAAVRLALLPPWQVLALFIGATALSLFAVRRRDLALPLLAPAALAIPFLPILPDRWPVVQILAGPLRYIVWLVIAAQLLWVLSQSGRFTPTWMPGWTRRRVAVAVALATALISITAAARLTSTVVFPGGDEPHYLVIAQSLWRDGDLKIANNHQRGDYHEYFEANLEPHYLAAGTDGEIYSVHPVGLPVLLAPIYAVGGYHAVVFALIAIAATAAGIAWWWTAGLIGSTAAATFAWLAIAGSAPFLFNTFTVYPEIAAALAVMVALVLAVEANAAAPGAGRWLAVGVACGALPWLSTKYAPMSAVLMLIALARAPKTARLALVFPYGAALIGWFAFFYAFWGSPWPQAPYGSMTQTTPANLLLGGPGLLFDQEYGLLAYAPVYILAVTGLLAMWRRGGELRRQAVEITLVFGALLGTVGAFGIWWGGTAAPARPIASGLLLFALPIATAFHQAPPGSPRRAAQHLLLWIGIGISITLAVAQQGLLINNDRDGTSALLEWWLPTWDTWTLAPSFTRRDVLVAMAHTSAWLLVAGAAATVLSRWRTARPGASALAASVTLATALTIISLVMPLLPHYPGAQPLDLRARSRLTALDGYDARRRPVAVIYDPARATSAASVIPLLRMEVEPGLRTDPQPVRVIHNGRFSVPAGRYDIRVTFGDQVPSRAEPLSLQVGRNGPPLETWALQPAAGDRWQAAIDLPVDVGFLGFGGSLDMERAISSIVITPVAVIDASARPRTPDVFAAARYSGVGVFIHDPRMIPEAAGFWTNGRSTSTISVAPDQGRTTPVVLTLHSGAKANRVTFSTREWRQTLDLVPGAAQRVSLPAPVAGVIALTIATEDGFSPSAIDPASRDTRFLGAWIEVAKD
ncbi:MAG: hypothetical protein ABI665_10745 [Vicinamibacterales bacterium]